jgi:prepilin-type N-terminal cleavage/methylation domain-containing protein
MNKDCMSEQAGKKLGGFTLIELLVVVLIIGILAAIAVPEYFKVVEKSRAAEAISTFDTIRGSEERYMAQTGSYWPAVGSPTAIDGGACLLDVCTNGNSYPVLSNFSSGAKITNSGNTWSLTLVRNSAPVGFGAYSLTYTAGGGTQASLTISGASDTNPCIDLGLGAKTGTSCY